MTLSLHQRSGEQALREPPTETTPPPSLQPIDCSFCTGTIPTDVTYHRMIVGMNEDGAASAIDAARTVEEVSEMCICKDCYPRVDILMDGFLERLWEARRPDLTVDISEPKPEPAAELGDTQRVTLPEVFATPYGPTSADSVALGAEILSLARQGYPPSPEGFLLGLVVGRLLAAGLSENDIHGIVAASVQTATRSKVFS